MKFNIKYTIAALSVFMFTAGCDDKLDAIDVIGYTGVPVAIETVTSEPLPGQIQLRWEVPAGDFSYLKIWYYDPLTKETVYKIVSKGTTELLIDETRARFGEYEFNFQTFNANDEGGEIKVVRALSGVAPASYTLVSRSQIKLVAEQLSTNAQEPSEGPIKNAVDGDKNTFFHTNWHEAIPYPQWIQVNLKEPHENFLVCYINRTDNSWTTSGRPSVVDLQISNNGIDWETVGTLDGLPSSAGSEYISTFFMPGKTFTYFRFSVTSATGSSSYWNIGEFMMYDAEVAIDDPETAPLD